MRKIDDDAILAKMDEMSPTGSKPKRILMCIRNLCGMCTMLCMRTDPLPNTNNSFVSDKKPTLKDVHNILARLKEKRRNGRSDAERTQAVLDEMCNNEPGSVACLYIGENSVVEMIAFQTRKMRRLFAAFPEVLMVDTTFNTNRNRYKLFSFVVMDIHGKVPHASELRELHGSNHGWILQGQYVQHALLTHESISNMNDAVIRFKKNNPARRSVKVIITDKSST